MEIEKIKLPKGSRTMSGELMAEKYGGDIIEDFKEWLKSKPEVTKFTVMLKLAELEKEYGIDYVE